MLDFSRKVYSRHPDCLIFGYSRSSSPEYALNYANEWDYYYSYSHVLKEYYPSSLFFSRGRDIFHNFQGRISLDELKASKKCLLLYGTPCEFLNGFVETELVDSSGKENLYKVKSSPSEEAMMFYHLAKSFESKKDFNNAMKFAYQARRMDLPKMDAYLIELQKQKAQNE